MLRNPNTGNSLVLDKEELIDNITGERFSIRNGIPVILRKDDVLGWNRKQQRNYDLFSPLYDAIFKFNIWNVKKWLAEIAEIIIINSGDHVLETAVGTGQQFRNFHENGVEANFFGNDISYGQLLRCKKNMQKWKIDLGLVQGNAQSLPFKDELFDVVFHTGSFNFFDDKELTIHEMIRVAKPGGSIYISDESAEFKEKSTFIGRLMPKSDSGAYEPPLNLIPKDMIEIKTEKIWDDKFWILSFKKPYD